MRFIRDLLGKKRSETGKRHASSVESLEQSYRDTIGSMVDESGSLGQAPAPIPADFSAAAANRTRVITPDIAPVAPAPAPTPVAEVNIWDLEDDGTSTALPDPVAPVAKPAPVADQAVASAAAARSPARSRRTKTRLIGFDKSDGDVVDLFNDAKKAAPTKSVKFPVGWIVVAEGPGRGESFSLMAGMSQIGRGEDQAIQLDFGDNSISRTNHAAIVFDPDTKEFLLGHGGKSNIVRLNDKPLISNETLKTGDVIRIGETALRFVALCDKSFNWSDGATEEDEDVAIA